MSRYMRVTMTFVARVQDAEWELTERILNRALNVLGGEFDALDVLEATVEPYDAAELQS